MLIIYNKNLIPNDKRDIAIPWDEYFNEYKITREFNEYDEQIIKNVEKTSLLNNETIQGKFSDMPIGIGLLSEGCKTLLCINHAIKHKTEENFIFNITECGGNAISYLADTMAKKTNVYAYVEHYDLGVSETCNIMIGNKIFSNAILAANELIHIQGESIK